MKGLSRWGAGLAMAGILALPLVLPLAAQATPELAAGTQVLAQTGRDVKFHPATVVKRALDGYTVKFEDGSVEDVLQADLAFDQPPDPARLTVDTKVAAAQFGEFYPGRIFEFGEGSYVVAWDSGGTDPIPLEDLRIRMEARSDPRPKSPAPLPPPAAPPAAPSAAPPANPAAPGPQAATPASPPPSAAALPGLPPMGGGGEDNPLGAILGMAGDKFLMKFSLVAPSKSESLVAKGELADITLVIPPDYVPVGLDFKIRNKSGKLLAVDWSKCYVTSFTGARHAVMHDDYGTLENIPAVEKPSEVPAGAELTFSLFSRDGIVSTFHAAHWEGSKWIEKYNEILNYMLFYGSDLPAPLIHGTSEADQAKDLESMRKNVVGKSFRVGIALTQGGKVSVVEFTVRIDGLDKGHDANVLDSIGKQ